mgnify:CR=1 FL=1
MPYPKKIIKTKEELLNEGFKLIESTFEGERLEKWYINSNGQIFSFFNSKKGNILKIRNEIEKGKPREPYVTFTHKNKQTKRTIKQLINTYFPNINNDYNILTHYKKKKLFSPLKVFKSGEIYTMSSTYSNVNKYLNIITKTIDRLVKYRTDKDGYKVISIVFNNRMGTVSTQHRIVMLAFDYCENSETKLIDHIDRNKENNCIDNLRWASSKTNQINRCVYENKLWGIKEIKTKQKIKYNVKITINYDYIQKNFIDINQAILFRNEIHDLRINNINISCEEIRLKYKIKKEDRSHYEKNKNIPNINIDKKILQDYDNYTIFRNGKIWSNKMGKWLKFSSDNKYIRTSLTNSDGKRVNWFVHRIIATCFIPNPENKPFVDHINRIRNDNRVENLRWVTANENANNKH